MRPLGTRTPLRHAAALPLLLGLLAAAGAHRTSNSPGRLVWERSTQDAVDGYQVSVADGDHVPLRELLGLAAEVLGMPISYSPTIIADTFVPLGNPRFLTQVEAPAFVEDLLQGQGVALVVRGTNTARIAEVFRPRKTPMDSDARLAEATLVAPDALEAWRGRHHYLRCVLPLEHVDARHVFVALVQRSDATSSAIQILPETNTLLLTNRADELCRALDLVRELDVPTTEHPQRPWKDPALTVLEARVAALEGG